MRSLATCKRSAERGLLGWASWGDIKLMDDDDNNDDGDEVLPERLRTLPVLTEVAVARLVTGLPRARRAVVMMPLGAVLRFFAPFTTSLVSAFSTSVTVVEARGEEADADAADAGVSGLMAPLGKALVFSSKPLMLRSGGWNLYSRFTTPSAC
jgi:hypothetical protein